MNSFRLQAVPPARASKPSMWSSFARALAGWRVCVRVYGGGGCWWRAGEAVASSIQSWPWWRRLQKAVMLRLVDGRARWGTAGDDEGW